MVGIGGTAKAYLGFQDGPKPGPQEHKRVEHALAIAHSARAASTEVHLSNTQALLQSDLSAGRAILQSALQSVRPFDAPAVTALLEINLATVALRQGDVDESRALLLRATRTYERIGAHFGALSGLRSLAEAEIAAGGWRDGLILFAAWDAVAAALDLSGFRTLEPEEAEAVQAAEEHLGPEAAKEARAIGERMTYREAFDFACEINGVTVP